MVQGHTRLCLAIRYSQEEKLLLPVGMSVGEGYAPDSSSWGQGPKRGQSRGPSPCRCGLRLGEGRREGAGSQEKGDIESFSVRSLSAAGSG